MTREELEAAYRATTYEATIDGEKIALRIDEPAPQLDDEWVFITAWNPGSEERVPEENARRQQELETLLRERGKRVEPGEGIPDPTSTWTPEKSVLAWPVGRDEALELGARFGQVAVVWGQRGGVAELLFC